MRRPHILSIIIAVFLSLTLTVNAAAQQSVPKKKRPRSTEQKETKEAKETKEKSVLVDNDVYLVTPEMWTALQRYYAGEIFDFDTEIQRLIDKSPHVFSAYFWAGMIKVRRQMIAPGDKSLTTGTVDLLETGALKARKAQHLKRFHDAGVFYESLCEMALAMYYGIDGSYLKAHHHAKVAWRQFQKIKKDRPKLHGVLLLDGMYNYYTGRFGFMTKLLLRLVGIEPGNTSKGIRMLKQACASESAFYYFANLYAVYIFAPRGSLRNEALRRSEVLIERYPNNYYGYLLKGYVLEKMKKYEEALQVNQRGRSLVPGDPSKYKDIMVVGDLFLFDVRIHYLRAMLQQDKASLDWLYRWSNDRKAAYADAPLIANMYLGHLYSQAGLDKQAMDFYEKMQSFPGAEWMKDQGKNYEKLPMRRRRHLQKDHAERIKQWLIKYPSIKA